MARHPANSGTGAHVKRPPIATKPSASAAVAVEDDDAEPPDEEVEDADETGALPVDRVLAVSAAHVDAHAAVASSMPISVTCHESAIEVGGADDDEEDEEEDDAAADDEETSCASNESWRGSAATATAFGSGGSSNSSVETTV